MKSNLNNCLHKLIYHEVNKGKFENARLYAIEKEETQNPLLCKKLKLINVDNYDFDAPDYWLSLRVAWFDKIVGLTYYSKHLIYVADKGHFLELNGLLLVKILDDFKTLIFYFFQGSTIDDLNQILNQVN